MTFAPLSNSFCNNLCNLPRMSWQPETYMLYGPNFPVEKWTRLAGPHPRPFSPAENVSRSPESYVCEICYAIFSAMLNPRMVRFSDFTLESDQDQVTLHQTIALEFPWESGCG